MWRDPIDVGMLLRIEPALKSARIYYNTQQAIGAHFSFLPRDVMLAQYMLLSCVCVSVCLSQVGVLLNVYSRDAKRIGSRKQRRTVLTCLCVCVCVCVC